MARRPQDDDPYAALIPGQQAEDDPYAALIPKQPTAAPTATTAPKQFGKGLARSAAQGLAFGFGEELEALPYLLPGGETREEALKRIRGEMSEYRQTYPKTAIGAELVGGLATGLAGGARALAAKTGASLARRGAAAAGRMALGNVGSSAIGGAGAAEGGLEDRLKGAATGAAIGVALPFGLGVVGKAIPEAARRRVTEGAATVYGKGLRGASDLAQQVGLSRVARALEPQDAIRAQQTLARQLPGSMEGGLTVESLGVGTDEAEQALRAAREEVSAAAATEAARAAETEAARSAVSQARAEGTARLTASKAQRQAQNVTAREQARLTEEIATPRQEKLTARAKQLRVERHQGVCGAGCRSRCGTGAAGRQGGCDLGGKWTAGWRTRAVGHAAGLHPQAADGDGPAELRRRAGDRGASRGGPDDLSGDRRRSDVGVGQEAGGAKTDGGGTSGAGRGHDPAPRDGVVRAADRDGRAGGVAGGEGADAPDHHGRGVAGDV